MRLNPIGLLLGLPPGLDFPKRYEDPATRTAPPVRRKRKRRAKFVPPPEWAPPNPEDRKGPN